VKINSLFRRKEIDQIIKESKTEGSQQLIRSLKVRDLTFIGIAAIIGAGIFGTIGTASANGGPAVSLLFIFTSVACLFSALCYAQFASSIPIAGSAYTYAYTSFGEIVAWIIGWDLLMEYAIGNVTVAISWSDYFCAFLEKGFHIKLPDYCTMDIISASRSVDTYLDLKSKGEMIPFSIEQGYRAWQNAPSIGPLKLIADLPALAINILITYLVYIGIKESKTTNNLLVGLKLVIIALVIIAGIGVVNTEYWSPFAPNGIPGVLQGVSAVFFAYIGFDAISTTAEEAINPKKDLPKAMIIALILCTVLYVAITLVLTGMVPFHKLGVGDPLAYAFEVTGLNFLSGVVAAGAVIAMTSVLLVFQLGQPRIWMSMSRDGLLPPAFAKIHPRFQTPSFSTIATGVAVGIPILFLNLQEVTDLTSIGTLFAFVLVCGGMLVKPPQVQPGGFRVPFYNGKYVIPILVIIGWLIAFWIFENSMNHFFAYEKWHLFKHKIPMILFIIVSTGIAILSFLKNLSAIPVLGLLTNFYLMSQLGWVSWIRFLGWLIVGLIIYFLYSYKKSKLHTNKVS
jgi:amino acid transporter